MKSLKPDKNYFLQSDIDFNLVRTGTVGEGSCFFHSILKAINPEYYNASIDEKIKLASKLRQEISEYLTLEKYKKISDGILAKISFDDNIAILLEKIYKENSSNVSNYQYILKNFSYKDIDEIMSKVLTSCGIDDCKHGFNQIFLKKYKNIPNNEIKIFSDSLFSIALEKSFKKFQKDIKNCSYFADETMFQLVSSYLNIDIYFITVETGKLYVMPGSCENITSGNRKSVIIGSVNNNHFENIGYRKSSSGPNKGVIERFFNPDHPLILKLQQILCK
jgi:hypothetical protein